MKKNVPADERQMRDMGDTPKIEETTFYHINYYLYGKAFKGSYQGMRFRLARNPLENVFFKPKEVQNAGTLMATVWPEPFSYENTDDEKKLTKEFSFSEDGKLAAVDWFNEQYESRKEEWDAAKHTDWSSLRK